MLPYLGFSKVGNTFTRLSEKIHRAVNLLPQSSRAQTIEACLRKIEKEDRIAPFRSNAQELLARASDPKATAAGLARTILRDLGLTTDTIRAANAPLRTRSGRRIEDIAHAVSFLGWEAIQRLVTAARFIEHFSDRSPVVRELLLMSVLNARHAREIATRTGHARCEEAYVLGLMRRIGDVLVAVHFPVQYAQALVAIVENGVPKDAAFLHAWAAPAMKSDNVLP
jgi:HD-like signal output (HDOD) protein